MNFKQLCYSENLDNLFARSVDHVCVLDKISCWTKKLKCKQKLYLKNLKYISPVNFTQKLLCSTNNKIFSLDLANMYSTLLYQYPEEDQCVLEERHAVEYFTKSTFYVSGKRSVCFYDEKVISIQIRLEILIFNACYL